MNWFWWALLSAFFAGLTAVLAKAGVTGIHSHLATAVRTSVVVVIAWAFALTVVPSGWLAAVPRRTWWCLLFSGLATAASWLCYFRALQLGDVSRVAPLDKLGVVFAVALATGFLGETLTWQQWLGCALIIAGAVLMAGKFT